MRKTFAVFLCLSLLCSLWGCDGGYKADQSFTYILPRSISTLDPQTASGSAESSVIDSIMEGLCRIDENGEVAPGVAKSWESSHDFATFTFHLRSDAKWSDGTQVTADDFVFGISRALTPATGTPGVEDMLLIKNARSVLSGELEADSLGVTARDERTLVVELEKGYSDFPALTAGIHFMPCNRDYFEQSAGHYGLSAEYLLTNGPFTFPSVYAWNTESGKRSVSLVKSEYYRGEHSVAPASLQFLIDYDSAIDSDPIAALLAGSVDILTLPESMAKKAEEQSCGVTAVSDCVTGLLLNPKADTLKELAVRELFIKTLDREELLSRRVTEENGAAQASGIMPDCVRWYGESYYLEGEKIYTPQDDSVINNIPSILSSMKLESIPSITVICPNDEESIKVVNGMLISWNGKLGSAFNLEPLSDSEFQSRLASGNYEAALYQFRAGGTTPFEALKAFESTASPTILNDPAFDAALKASDFSLSSARNLESLIEESYVFYPLFRDNTYCVTNPNVQKITVSPDMGVDFSQARKKG